MKYKRVVSFGDSFTYGTELNDSYNEPSPSIVVQNPEQYPRELEIIKQRQIGPFSPHGFEHSTLNMLHRGHSYSTWPALVAKHLNLKYICHAWPGSGNQSIVRKILQFINEINTDDLLIINWTYISRWDFYDYNNCLPKERWVTITPGSPNDTEFAKIYFKYMQSELWDKWETLRNILTISSLLKNKNIDFIMTCQDTLVLDDQYYLDAYITNTQNEINSDLFWFDGKGFNEWAEGYPRGNNGHPLEEAHQAAFEYLRDNYDFT